MANHRKHSELGDLGLQQASPTPPSFQRAIQLKGVEGTDNCYSTTAERPWSGYGGTRAFGGWANSVIFNATRKYFSTKYASRNQPDPIGITTHYLLPLPLGLVKLVIQDIRIGRAQSVVRVEVLQGEAPKSCIVATVTHGNLQTEDGITLPAEKLPLPDRAECDPLLNDLVMRMVPAMANVIELTPRGGSSALWTPKAGQNARDYWVRFTDQPGGWDLLSLGYASDICPPIAWNYENSIDSALTKWDVRTMSLSIDVRRDPKGEKWLMQRAVMHEARNGRSDTDIKIINPKGEIVAIVHQLNIAIPSSKRSKKEMKETLPKSSL